MPVLDQPVARQVGLDFSKMRTLQLDPSNSSLSSLSHLKGVPGLSNMRSFAAKAYESKGFRSPNQERTSVMFVGVGKSCIVSRYFLYG